MDVESLKRLIAALDARGVRYAIFGAVAMSLHGLVHTTEDLDLFVAPDESNIDRLRAAFAFDDLEVQRLQVDDVTASVVSPRTLYKMKKDTVRAKDRADAEMLRRAFDLEDE